MFASAALPMEYSDSILMPKTYDLVWSLIPLVVILFYWALITVIERKRGSGTDRRILHLADICCPQLPRITNRNCLPHRRIHY